MDETIEYELKHTGPQIDALLDKITNTNLLHNWDFRNPVNQRGIVSGATISTPGYFIDGWKLISGSCIWTAGQRLAVSNTSVVAQYMEKYYGAMLDKTYTFSIDTSDGIKSVTFKFPAAVSGETVYTETGIAGYCTIKAGFEYRSGGTAICGTTQYYVPFIEITAADDIDIIPYLEPHNVSTMANATEPDFGDQLALCKRFYERINDRYCVPFTPAYNTSYVAFSINYADKRTIPTITYEGTLTATVSVPGVGSQSATSFSVSDPGKKTARINIGGSFIAGNVYGIIGDFLDIRVSADL